MRRTGLVVAAVLVLTAGGCGDEPDDGTPPAGRAPGGAPGLPPEPPPTYSLPPATPPTHQVADEDCPEGWMGLEVTTDTQAEVEFLDDVPACTDGSGSMTYLENRSDAVWTLDPASSRRVMPRGGTYVEWSFVQAVGPARPGRAILVPGAEMTVELPPGSVEWALDLPLSLGFQGHEVVLDEVREAGEEAAVAALRRQSPAGAALASCTLAVVRTADDASDLADADAVDVVLVGLGVGAGSSGFQRDATAARTVDDANRPVALADEMRGLTARTDVLERIHTRAGYAQRAAKALNFLRLVGPG